MVSDETQKGDGANIHIHLPTHPNWVVMVTMNHKNGDANVIVGIFKVDYWKGAVCKVLLRATDNSEVNRPVSHTVPPHLLHRIKKDLTRRLVLMEQVTALKNEIHVIQLGLLKDFLKCLYRVFSSHYIFLQVPNMVISCYGDGIEKVLYFPILTYSNN